MESVTTSRIKSNNHKVAFPLKQPVLPYPDRSASPAKSAKNNGLKSAGVSRGPLCVGGFVFPTKDLNGF